MARSCRRATARPMSARRAIEDIDSAKIDPADRHQPAARSAGAERPHPQGLDATARWSGWSVPAVDLTYDYAHVGTDRAALANAGRRRSSRGRRPSRRW